MNYKRRVNAITLNLTIRAINNTQFDPGGGGELTLHFKINKNNFPRTPYETCRDVWPTKYLYKTVFTFAVSCLVAAEETLEKTLCFKKYFFKILILSIKNLKELH